MDLAGNIEVPPPLGAKVERELLIVSTEISMLALQPIPPKISSS